MGKTITLVVHGDLPLDTFAEALTRLQRLIKSLSREVGGQKPIAWVLADLDFGSADMTFAGQGDDPDAVERVARAYLTVGQALARKGVIPYRPEIAKHARALVDLVGDRVTAIEFKADGEAATVSASNVAPPPALVGAYGAISGQVETLRMRGGLQFTLYDDLFDRPVRCELRTGQEDLMRDAWGRTVLVEGWVERNSLTGIPARVADIERIQIVPERPDVGYWHARGVAPHQKGDPRPEELIRLVRDA
jgi:hypothetical protein